MRGMWHRRGVAAEVLRTIPSTGLLRPMLASLALPGARSS